MQRLALERGRVRADRAAVLAEDLEAAEVNALLGDAGRLSQTLRTRWPEAS